MKTILALLISFTCVASVSIAQFQKGTTELAMSGNFGTSSTKSSSNSLYGNNSSSQSINYATLNVIVGFFLADGISLEPEVGWFAAEQQKPMNFLLVNISYTMPNPTSKVSPFIRAGYGISNSFAVPSMNAMGRVSDKMDVGVLNLGAGVKYLVGTDFALRLEVNYRKQSFSQTNSYYTFSSTTDVSLATTGLLFGFSVLL